MRHDAAALIVRIRSLDLLAERLMSEGKTKEEAERDWQNSLECSLVVPLDVKVYLKCGKEQYYFGQT